LENVSGYLPPRQDYFHITDRYHESATRDALFFDGTPFHPGRYPEKFLEICPNPSVLPCAINLLHEQYLRIRQDFDFMGEGAVDRTAFTAPPVKSWAPGSDDNVGRVLKDSDLLFNILELRGAPVYRTGPLGCPDKTKDPLVQIFGHRAVR
jgi:hypothetical protein